MYFLIPLCTLRQNVDYWWLMHQCGYFVNGRIFNRPSGVGGSGWFVSDALNAVEFMVRNSLNPLLSLRCPTRTLKLSKCWAWALGMMGNASSCGYHFFLSPLSYSAIFYFKCVTFGADLCAITVMICLNKKKIEEIVCGAKIQILAFLSKYSSNFQRLGSNLVGFLFDYCFWQWLHDLPPALMNVYDSLEYF